MNNKHGQSESENFASLDSITFYSMNALSSVYLHYPAIFPNFLTLFSLLHLPYFIFPTSSSLLHLPYFIFPTSSSLLHLPYFIFPTSSSLLHLPYCISPPPPPPHPTPKEPLEYRVISDNQSLTSFQHKGGVVHMIWPST